MKVIYYPDVVFIINFSMNLLLLEIERRLLHYRIKKVNEMIAALFGSIFSVVFFMLELYIYRYSSLPDFFFFLSELLVAGVIACIMQKVLLYPRKRTGKGQVLFFTLACLVGGGMELFFVRNFNEGKMTTRMFGVIYLLMWLLIPVVTTIVGGIEREQEVLRQVTVCVGSREIVGTGFWDSGNQAVEPKSGAPVCFVSEAWIKEKLLYREWEELLSYKVPYHSIGKCDGMVSAMKAEWVSVGEGNNKKVFFHVYLGIEPGGCIDTEKYQMILNYEMK